MAPPIAVQRAKQPLLFDHLPQARHHRQRRFLLDQLRVVDLAGRIVQNHDQVVIPVVLKPAMLAAIDVQQHARQRPPRSAPPMRARACGGAHQARALQGLLDPAVAQLDVVLLAQLLVKVQNAEIEVLLLVQRQDPLGRLQRNAVHAALSAPLVEQPVVTKLLVSSA